MTGLCATLSEVGEALHGSAYVVGCAKLQSRNRASEYSVQLTAQEEKKNMSINMWPIQRQYIPSLDEYLSTPFKNACYP